MTRVPPTSRSWNHPVVARRVVLRGGSLAAVLAPLAACTTQAEQPKGPDPLLALAEQARTDAAVAAATAKSAPELATVAHEIAKAREEHAAILQREVDRVRPPGTTAPNSSSSAPPPPTGAPSAKTGRQALIDALRDAEQKAAALVPTVPRYRAGMLGSVAAGCACLREVLG